MSKIGKIINFPSKALVSSSPFAQLYSEKNRAMVIGSLITVLVLFTVANDKIAQSSRATGHSDMASRSVASQNSVGSTNRDVDWENSMAQKIDLITSSRELASIGKRPTQLEDLQFGLLEGKYSLTMQGEKILKLEFSQGDRSQDRPKYITDRVAFLEDYRELLPVHFAHLRLVDDVFTDEEVREVYGLFDTNNVQIGSVAIRMDIYGRLLAMSVE